MSFERLTAALADRYTIERELGQGGMATVYLAQDLKHDRQVAIKVLKPELAAVLGAERFVVEIKTTAALQHPHILPLFDSGEADGFLFYVMPFIAGETLRGKLDRETQLSIEAAVKTTTEVADALHYAHSQGVVHRDIKPENILLANGRPMVADFGIALALSAAAGGRITETGMSLGTPHYMSPEQATADKEITGRSDIYSLASVCYEMLVGDPPHTGSSAQQIIMKIVAEEAQPVTTLRKSVPPNVAAALVKALEKVPADRFETAAAFAEALNNTSFTTAGTGLASGVAGGFGSRRRPLVQLGIAAALGIAVASAGWLLFGARPVDAPVVRFAMTFPDGHSLLNTAPEDAPFAISPDGRRIVYVARDSGSRLSRLYVRTIDQLDGVPLQGTEDVVAPFFSPDGLWVGFATSTDEKLMKVPVSGGPPTTLATDVQNNVASASWGDDGYIVYVSAGTVLSRVSSAGGAPEQVVSHDSLQAQGGRYAVWPIVLPGGEAVLFTKCGLNCSTSDLSVLDVATGAVRVVVPGASRGWYLRTGVLVYSTNLGTIYAVPFDLKAREVTGAPIPVLERVQTGLANGARLAISQSGAMIYLSGDIADQEVDLVEVDRSGRERLLTIPSGNFSFPRWSPSRDRIAVTRADAQGAFQIWIYDVRSETLSQLTFDGRNVRPSWSPDGRRVAYYSTTGKSEGLHWIPADGSGSPERVEPEGKVLGQSSTFWTRDGAWIVIDGAPDELVPDNQDIFAIGTGADRRMVPVVASPVNEQTGAVSPDGKWIAYASTEGGTEPQVYVRPFMAPGGKFLISQGFAAGPLWGANDEIVYRDLVNGEMVAARLELGAIVRVIERASLFRAASFRSSINAPQYDVSWDGQHFLMLREREVAQSNSIPTVVLNWFAEVKRLMVRQAGT